MRPVSEEERDSRHHGRWAAKLTKADYPPRWLRWRRWGRGGSGAIRSVRAGRGSASQITGRGRERSAVERKEKDTDDQERPFMGQDDDIAATAEAGEADGAG